jgi:predicted amino acid racemase
MHLWQIQDMISSHFAFKVPNFRVIPFELAIFSIILQFLSQFNYNLLRHIDAASVSLGKNQDIITNFSSSIFQIQAFLFSFTSPYLTSELNLANLKFISFSYLVHFTSTFLAM